MGNEIVMEMSELNAKLQLIMAMETIVGYHTILSAIVGDGPARAIGETILQDAQEQMKTSITDELRRRGLPVPQDSNSEPQKSAPTPVGLYPPFP